VIIPDLASPDMDSNAVIASLRERTPRGAIVERSARP
jgi:hypothetical protein